MQGLCGLGVLVTRPEHQAAPLCRLLEAEGAEVYPFAALRIEPIAPARPATGGRFDLLIFVSANAVRCGAALLASHRDAPLAAVGPATARALREAGYPVSIQPAGGFDSASLLADPRLRDLAGRRLLLVKGIGGRGLLETELKARGASVEVADVYRRAPAAPSAESVSALTERFAAVRLHVVTATSGEVAEALWHCASPALRAYLQRAHWLVPSDRVGRIVRGLGVDAPLLRAASAEDQDLVAELLRWRSSESVA